MPFTYDPMLAVVWAVLDMGAPAGGRSRGIRSDRTIAGGICEKNWFLFSSSRCVIKYTETLNLKCTCTMLELFPSRIDGIHHCMCPHAAVQLPTKSKEVPLTGVLGGRMLRPLMPSSAAVEALTVRPRPRPARAVSPFPITHCGP